jgi:membrane fusion protein (multidrug efflux system)
VSIDDAYVRADTVDVSTDVGGLVAQVAVQGQPACRGRRRAVPARRPAVPHCARGAPRRSSAWCATTSPRCRRAIASSRRRSARPRSTSTSFSASTTARPTSCGAPFHRSQQFDAARRNLEDARQSLANFTQALAAIVANLAAIPTRRSSTSALSGGGSDARRGGRQLSHTVVRAPFAGVVALAHQLQPGEYLPAAQTAFELVAIDRAWIEAEPKETELTYVRAGQPVTFTVDTYPGLEWHGTVESLSPASGARSRCCRRRTPRQLGQGRAAHPGAAACRPAARPATAARRHERRRRDRYRPSAPARRHPGRRVRLGPAAAAPAPALQ